MFQKVQRQRQHSAMNELGPRVGRVSTTAHFLINSIMALSIINGPVMTHLCSTILKSLDRAPFIFYLLRSEPIFLGGF